MTNSEYFMNALGRVVSNTAFNKYGAVGISIQPDSDGLRILIYDSSLSLINHLSDTDRKKHILFNKLYDISTINFDVEHTVYQKLNEISVDLELNI